MLIRLRYIDNKVDLGEDEEEEEEEDDKTIFK